ncbi:MAG TPA: hypothetical protein VML55_21915 [Planctomycetaceae bacterium]|nr:hypothetical protein [Planctomycetaceae bacterium]
MAGRPGDPPTFRYRDLFPWLHVFHAFRLARDGRKVLLAAAALLLIAAGNRLLSTLPFASEESAPRWPWAASPASAARGLEASGPDWLVESAAELLRPLAHLLEPGRVLLGRADVGASAVAWAQLLWALAVWSFLGAAITRMAAVEFARDERISLMSAGRFAGSRFLSYFSSPLLPIGFILAMWVLCFVGGLIGRLPWVGETLAGALWFIPLALGFFMALLVIGIAAGWPLMVATISSEATDAYDGFSRSYSYIYSRPWHAVWYAIVAVAYGLVVLVWVKLVASFVVYLAGWAVSLGLNLDDVGSPWTPFVSDLSDPARFTRDTPGWISAGRPLAGFWLHALVLAVVAFASSYFWTAATIIYMLLRQSEDATDLDEVYVTTEAERDDLLPLVGAAASEQAVIERPAKPPEGASQREDATG